MNPMYRVVFFLAFFFLGMYVGNFLFPVQAQAPSKYQPTEVENLKLQNKQMKALLINQQVKQDQANLAGAVADLTEEANTVKKAHGWGDKVGFDMLQVSFCDNLSQQGSCPPAAVLPQSTPPAPTPPTPAKEEKPEAKKP